jgi:hypothetical protein
MCTSSLPLVLARNQGGGVLAVLCCLEQIILLASLAQPCICLH